jgi:uncharacterized membrane protein
MKLEDYAIRQHIADCNWRAAVDMVADHFAIKIPQSISIGFIRSDNSKSQVSIFNGSLAYHWLSSGSFVRFDTPGSYHPQSALIVFPSITE